MVIQKFKVGDKVEIKAEGSFTPFNVGKVGRVCLVLGDSIAVSFKNWKFGHTCGGRLSSPNAWCYNAINMELTNKKESDFKEI